MPVGPALTHTPSWGTFLGSFSFALPQKSQTVGADVIESWLEACEITDPLSSVIIAHELVNDFHQLGLDLIPVLTEDDDQYLEGLLPLASRSPIPALTAPA